VTSPLSGRNAIVFGVERPAGRRVAVALAESGADVAVVTLSENTQAEFAANSTANEFWAIGRKGIVLTSDGRATSVAEAIADATVELGPISILVWHGAHAPSREAFAGMRSDPAVVVITSDDDAADDAHALLAWTRDLAAAGLRANAVVAAPTNDAFASVLKVHRPPEPMDTARAAVYLASDATAAIEATVIVAVEP
jgi:NAD(P)-dependent dehydrogenase (short-subunit alcohol dehydrogenase family)